MVPYTSDAMARCLPNILDYRYHWKHFVNLYIITKAHAPKFCINLSNKFGNCRFWSVIYGFAERMARASNGNGLPKGE